MTVDPTKPPLTLRLFGPFEARRNGAPLPRLRSRKGLWLLALLALRQGREVERDWLAGTLWPDSGPARGSHNLSMSLTDLRHALGPDAVRLRSPARHTLCLDLAGAAVDVLAFDVAVARGDPSSLEEAVALYRGPLLEGCAEEWVFQERQVREQAYLGALETLAARAQSGGDPGGAERHLRRVVAADPLRETAQRELMQVLAAGGNYAAAGQVYRDLRLRLHREVNSEPDPETTALFQQLRAMARGQAVAAPSALHRTAPAVSDAPLSAPDGPERADDFPALPRLSAFPHNLPLQLTRFIGRERELVAVKELLATHRLVTLTGPGGCGKTRLALQVAADLLYNFADGVRLVELAPVLDPSLVLPAVAAAFGVREEAGWPLLTSLTACLRPKSLLLVLDNFEQVLAAAPQVRELLAGAPRVTVLVTSRAPLRLQGEQEYSVPPLALPDPKHLPPVETLSRVEAVALFIQRAQAVKPEFSVTEENAAAVAEICRRLDGLPLAIELAAARVKLFSPQALLRRMASRLKLLTCGARDAPARHQTLLGCVRWSYDLLAEEEKALFRRLSVFVGGCTLAAAEAVCGNVEGKMQNAELGKEDPSSILHSTFCILHSEEVLDLLASLVDQSLLTQEEQRDGEPRFLMLPTIREFGLACLAQSGEAELARQRHRDYFLALAEEAELQIHGAAQGEWLVRLEGEHDNLRAALAWCAERGDAEAGLRLGGVLWRFWMLRGYLTEGREQLTKLLSLPGAEAPTVVRGRALHGAGVLTFRLGEYEAARALLQESLALGRELGTRPDVARALYNLAHFARGQGEYEQAQALYEECLALGRDLGSHLDIARSLGALAHLARETGDYARSAAYYRESLALRHSRDEHFAVAQSLENFAGLAGLQRQWERAVRLLGAAESVAQTFGQSLPLVSPTEYQHTVDGARSALGETAFAAAWAAGRVLSLEQAITLALEE